MMPVTPVFLIRLISIVLAVAVVGAVLGVAAGKNVFKMQGVAWFLTALLVVAAVDIGSARANYVRDNANVLSGQTEQVLDERNDRLWERHRVTVGVVTCNYNRDDLYDYTVKQFEAMGLGGGDMLVVLDISGENYGLYAGRSVSRQFSDQDCSDYAYDYMEDFFAREMYDDAVLGLTEALEVWYGENYG